MQFDGARFASDANLVLHGVRSSWARPPSSFHRDSCCASGVTFFDGEFLAESPICHNAAAIAAASEFAMAAAAEFAVTEVAVAVLAPGFTFGAGDDAVFFTAVDFAA